ncbi:hypothetical protein ACIPOG_00025 [Kriegella sp. LARHCF250]
MDGQNVTPEILRDALHAELRKLRSGVEWVRLLDAAVALRNYSFRNVALITLQMPYASQVNRSDIWQKFGRSITAGQQDRAIRILAPVVEGGGRKTPVADSGAELPLARARSARGGGRHVGYKVASVWDVSQTDGPPMLPPARPAGGVSPADLWRALAHKVRSVGYTVVEGRTLHAGLEGFTDHQARTVVIRRGLDEVMAVARLAHEVAHLRMHSPKEVASAGSVMCRGLREIEAESVAYMLLAHHGLTTGGSSFRYVRSWAASVNKREPELVIEQAGSRSVTIARRMTESLDRQVRRARVGRDGLPAQVLDHPAFRHDGNSRTLGGPER